jgi:hypothetical protein
MSMSRRFRCSECEQVGGLEHCESLAHLGELLLSAEEARRAAPTGRHRADEEPDDNDPYASDGYGA